MPLVRNAWPAMLALSLTVPRAGLSADDAAATSQPAPQATPAGHSFHGEVFNEGPRQKAYLMGGTGNVSLAISTKSPEAQAFFNQGLGQLHGFWYFEAERSFRQAAVDDPDCAMLYWGMAMANRENERRGKGFIQEAVKRKAAASPREQLWIDALAAYFDAGPKSQPRDMKQRRQDYIKALERIIHEHPEELEAKAFLGLQLWQNRSEIPISSHEAVDALLREVHAANPMHPAHHYRIHLWDDEKPARALGSAAVCGQSAPGIAHMWHMPGHTYAHLQRYADAAWQQEASARVDHAHMMRDRVMPDQIHNYAHNNDWLVEDLAFIGRVRDAIDLAKNLVELPRHPKYNTVERWGSARSGRNRLFQVLREYELWDELIALCNSPYLEPTEQPEEQARRLQALGAAYMIKGELLQGKTYLDELRTRLEQARKEQVEAGTKAEAKARQEKKSGEDVIKAKESAIAGYNGRIQALENAVDELQGRWALAAGDFEVAEDHLRDAQMSKEVLSRAYLAAGNREKAEEAARQAVEQGKNRVYPLANQVEVLFACGRMPEATEAFRRLQAISGSIDMQAPIFQRLTELAPKLGLPADWRQPLVVAGDVGERPDLNSLGPFRWQPSPAADFSLPDADGNQVTLAQFRGRATILIFYLGFGCLHCVEQLNTFAPMYKEFGDAGIDIVAVSTDAADVLKQGLAARAKSSAGPLPMPLVSDADLSVFKRYRCYDDFENLTLHGTFLVDGDGLVRWQDISFEPFTDARFLLQEARRLLSQGPGAPSAATAVGK